MAIQISMTKNRIIDIGVPYQLIHNILMLHNIIVNCKHFTADVPGAPERPTITNVDATSIGITWSTPEADGGSPVSGYVIEQRVNASPDWSKAFKGIVEDTTFTVTDLKKGNEYEFRVAAVNKTGQGEFSEPSPSTLCKAAESKCETGNFHYYEYVEKSSNVQ